MAESLRERQREAVERLCAKSPKGKPVEGREINLTASLRSGPEYSFTPHPKVECKKKTVDLPGPGEYYCADEPERSKTSFSIGPSINDLGGCPVELLHCSHCEKKTLESWTPAERGKRPRPKECSTKGCAYLAAENRSYCCCSCSKATPAPGYMPPPPVKCAPRAEAKTKSLKKPQNWPEPGQYDLKSTLEGIDVKGKGWIKPEKKDDKEKKEPPGPGSFEPRHSFTSRSSPSIGFGSSSRWKDLPKLPREKKDAKDGKDEEPSSPGPGAYNTTSLTGRMRNPMAVSIKGPWPDRDRADRDLRDPKDPKAETKKDETLAPVGPGPPMTSFRPKRFSR